MKLQIIERTIVIWLRRLLLWAILLAFILLLFINEKSEIKSWHIFLFLILIYLVRIILYIIFDPSKETGFLSLDSDGKCSIIRAKNNETIILKNIVLYYSGHAGKPYPVWYFFSLKNLDSGYNNFLIINDRKVRVLLANKEEWDHLKTILDDLQGIGIKTEIFKFHFIKALHFKTRRGKIGAT